VNTNLINNLPKTVIADDKYIFALNRTHFTNAEKTVECKAGGNSHAIVTM